MRRGKNIAQAVKALSNQFHRYMASAKPDAGGEYGEVTGIQSRIVSHLYECREPVYQRDIERHFNIRRSTATNLLKRIEAHGLIERSACKNDLRMKTINLTDKAKRLYPAVRRDILKAERQAAKGLTDGEIALFFRVVEKMAGNIA